jgi:hypothetical protein
MLTLSYFLRNNNSNQKDGLGITSKTYIGETSSTVNAGSRDSRVLGFSGPVRMWERWFVREVGILLFFLF